MPNIPSNVQWNPKWQLSDFALSLQKLWQQTARVINNLLSFGSPGNPDNINGAWVPFTIVAPNADLTLTHNLGRIPVGYIVMSKTAACDIYTGGIAASATQITIRGTVGGVSGYLFVV